MDDIRQTTVEDLARHYRTYYVPNNAFLIVVGDIDAPRLVAAVQRAFGGAPAGAPPETVRSVEPVQQGERRVEVRREAELPFVALAYHAPNIATIDGAALEVLETLLAGGESARLHHELVYQRRLAGQVGVDYDTLSADPGLFAVYAQPLPGKTVAEVEAALHAQIDRIRSSPPDPAELAKAKKSIEARYVFAQDSLFYQALWLGQYEIGGDWRRIDHYLPAIRSVTGDDVVRVASTYLDRDNQTVATLIPTSSSMGRSSRSERVHHRRSG
jgi:zinc protease